MFYQPITSTPDNSSFIIKSKHQSVFDIGGDWTLDFLLNY